ncbi:MAG: HEAT repeat domain-containing protein [Spirochaetales bacterium]|nr:HEAT repeat domain-containing protein [Spirochaetales bacterium]
MIRILCLLSIFLLGSSLSAEEVPGLRSLQRRMLLPGALRQNAIRQIKEYGHHSLARQAAGYLLKSSNYNDHLAVLDMMQAYGGELEMHLPDWYKFLDAYMDPLLPVEILTRILALAESWREHRLIHAVAQLATHPRREVREKAFETLASMENDNMIPVLLRLLGNERPIYRIYALEGLRHISDKRITSSVESYLKDTNKSVRVYAISSLLKQPDASESSIARMQNDPSPDVRAHVLATIGERGWVRHRNIVQNGITDRSELVRQTALTTAAILLETGSAGAISNMLEFETSKQNKLSGIRLLMEFERGGRGLGMVLRSDPDAEVRLQAALAIGYTGYKDGMYDLVHALSADKDARVRTQAADSLGMLGLSAAADHLEHAVLRQDDYEVRSAALQALLRVTGNSTGSLERVLSAMGGDDFRKHVEHALSRVRRESLMDS